MKLTELAYRNIHRNKRRSILSGSAIAVATMSIVLLFAMMDGMIMDIEKNQKRYLTGAIRIRNAEFAKYERLNPSHLYINEAEQKIDELKEYPWITQISQRINFPGQLYTDNDRKYNISGMAVDFTTEEEFQKLDEALAIGRLPEAGAKEAVIGINLAERIGIDLTDGIPDEIMILTQKSTRLHKHFKMRVVGLLAYPVSAMNSTTVLIPLDRAQDFLIMNDGVSEIQLMVDEDTITPDEGAELLRTEMGTKYSELKIESWLEDNLIFGMMDMAKVSYYIMAMFFFVLGSSVIINTTIMVIFERMKEIGTMGAIGMKGSELVRLFFLEAFYISALGAFAGVAIGWIITLITSKTGIPLGEMTESLEDFSMSPRLYLQTNTLTMTLVFIYSVCVSSVATFIPSIRASRIQPVEALRSL